MSFFDDLKNEFKIDDLTKFLSVTYIENNGAKIIGKFKILSFNEEEICLKTNSNLVKIFGENLLINSVSKGELLVNGKVKQIALGD